MQPKFMLLLAALTIVLSFQCNAQVILPKNNEGKIEYTEIVSVDSANASDLFSRAKLFITNAFKSGKDVTQLVDENAKTVVAKGLIPVKVRTIGTPIQAYVTLKITIDCKDNKYRYSFTDLIFEYQPGTLTPTYKDDLAWDDPKHVTKKQFASIKEQTNESVTTTIASLKKEMSKAKTDEW